MGRGCCASSLHFRKQGLRVGRRCELPHMTIQSLFSRNPFTHANVGCPQRGKSGFTLVEVMIAVVITGLVLTAAFGTVAQSLRTVELGRDYTRVAQIMQSEMEDLRTRSWADLEELQSDNEWGSSGIAIWQLTLSADFQAMFGDRYDVWCVLLDREVDQKEIRIWVRWQNAQGDWINKITSTWFTENGLHDYYYRSF